MITALSERVISVLLLGAAEDLAALLPPEVFREVDHAPNAAAALMHLAEKAYDLVLIDHKSEGEITDAQIAYLRAAQAIRPHAKLIVVATHSTTRKVIESLRHGVYAYFSRPFEPTAVRNAIAQALMIQQSPEGIEVISADPDFISLRLRCRLDTADRLAQFMREMPCPLGTEERSQLSMALREMLLNAIEHGGKFNPDEWVRVSRVRTRRTIVYHIEDPGEGFQRNEVKHSAILNPADDPIAHIQRRIEANMRAGGFGILMTTELVDEVIYSQKGNEVILIKHLD